MWFWSGWVVLLFVACVVAYLGSHYAIEWYCRQVERDRAEREDETPPPSPGI